MKILLIMVFALTAAGLFFSDVGFAAPSDPEKRKGAYAYRKAE